MVHVHVAFCSPLGPGYMPQSGTYQHQGALSIRESPYRLRPALYLPVEPFDGIVGPDPCPVLGRKVHVGEGLLYAILHLFCCCAEFHLLQFFCYLGGFLPGGFLALLGMDGLQHHGNAFHLIAGRDGKYVPVKMYGAALVARIREYLRDRLQHAQVLIPDDEPDAGKPPFLEPYKEGMPAFLILFHAFRCPDDLTAAAFTYADGHKDGYVLYLAAPAALEVYTVDVDIGYLLESGRVRHCSMCS